MGEQRERLFHVADDGHVGVYDLVDFGGVDLQVDDLGVRPETARIARHAVVEAHAHGDQEVGVADGFVGGIGSVHAEHAEPLRVIAGECAEAHQGTGHRDAECFGEAAEFFAGVGHDHAAAAEQQGALRLVERVHDLADLGEVGAVGL